MATLREEDGLGVSETTSEVGNVTAMLALSEQVKEMVSDIRLSLPATSGLWEEWECACGTPLAFEPFLFVL